MIHGLIGSFAKREASITCPSYCVMADGYEGVKAVRKHNKQIRDGLSVSCLMLNKYMIKL